MPPTPVQFQADEGQIRQIVWNLATNGLRAMPGGGTLTLAVTPPSDDAPFVVISVADEGVGIAPEELDGIFQPFRGGFERGTGLGLSIVHRIVSDYGGEVRVSSTQGAGTTVFVRFPVAANADAAYRVRRIDRRVGGANARRAEHSSTADRTCRRPRSARVLVVDDERSMRELLSIVLRRDGYEVLVADDGKAARRDPQARARRRPDHRHPDAGDDRRRRAARGEDDRSRRSSASS